MIYCYSILILYKINLNEKNFIFEYIEYLIIINIDNKFNNKSNQFQ